MFLAVVTLRFMSQARHASVRGVLALLGRGSPKEGGASVNACGNPRIDELLLTATDAEAFRDGTLDSRFRITCPRCQVIADAALENVSPFPFELPGVTL